jgi:hypothetical protein
MGRYGVYHVDHCHKTNKRRGLLCHKCNVGLGMVQDSVEHLEKLIAYLIKHQATASETFALPFTANQTASIFPV